MQTPAQGESVPGRGNSRWKRWGRGEVMGALMSIDKSPSPPNLKMWGENQETGYTRMKNHIDSFFRSNPVSYSLKDTPSISFSSLVWEKGNMLHRHSLQPYLLTSGKDS